MDAEKFGAFVANIRKERQMTQADLASKLQVTDKAVSRWERGLGLPDINTLEPLADALQVSVLELMKSEVIEATSIHCAEAETVLFDTLKEAQEQRAREKKQEQRVSSIVISIAAFLTTCILLLDHSGWRLETILFTGIGILLPLMSAISLLALIVCGMIRRIMGKPSKRIFIVALMFLTILVCIFLALVIMGIYAFPGQN